MPPELFASILAGLLSLLMSYVPGFEGRYGGLTGALKRLVMLALLALIALAVYGLACSGLAPTFGLTLTCDADGCMCC